MEADCNRKLEEMQKYIPFLNRTIRRLDNSSSLSDRCDKLREIRDLLSGRQMIKMEMEKLLAFEQILLKIKSNVEEVEPSLKSAPENMTLVPYNSNPLPTTSINEENKLENSRKKLLALQRDSNPETHCAGVVEQIIIDVCAKRMSTQKSKNTLLTSSVIEEIPRSPESSVSPRSSCTPTTYESPPLYHRRSRTSLEKYQTQDKEQEKKLAKEKSQKAKHSNPPQNYCDDDKRDKEIEILLKEKKLLQQEIQRLNSNNKVPLSHLEQDGESDSDSQILNGGASSTSSTNKISENNNKSRPMIKIPIGKNKVLETPPDNDAFDLEMYEETSKETKAPCDTTEVINVESDEDDDGTPKRIDASETFTKIAKPLKEDKSFEKRHLDVKAGEDNSSEKLLQLHKENTEKRTESQKLNDNTVETPNVMIPKLNDNVPTVPTEKANTGDVDTQKDILRDLIHDILNGDQINRISEASTPILHQPKVTKVTKDISIDEYKQKTKIAPPIVTPDLQNIFSRKEDFSRKSLEDSVNQGDLLKTTSTVLPEFNKTITPIGNIDFSPDQSHGLDKMKNLPFWHHSTPASGHRPAPDHTFGGSRYPPTPQPPLGAHVSTPSHPRTLECRPSPSHSFDRSECSTTQQPQLSESDCLPTQSPILPAPEIPLDPIHPYSKYPSTSSHYLGQSVLPTMAQSHFRGSEHPSIHSTTLPGANILPHLNNVQSGYIPVNQPAPQHIPYPANRNYPNLLSSPVYPAALPAPNHSPQFSPSQTDSVASTLNNNGRYEHSITPMNAVGGSNIPITPGLPLIRSGLQDPRLNRNPVYCHNGAINFSNANNNPNNYNHSLTDTHFRQQHRDERTRGENYHDDRSYSSWNRRRRYIKELRPESRCYPWRSSKSEKTVDGRSHSKEYGRKLEHRKNYCDRNRNSNNYNKSVPRTDLSPEHNDRPSLPPKRQQSSSRDLDFSKANQTKGSDKNTSATPVAATNGNSLVREFNNENTLKQTGTIKADCSGENRVNRDAKHAKNEDSMDKLSTPYKKQRPPSRGPNSIETNISKGSDEKTLATPDASTIGNSLVRELNNEITHKKQKDTTKPDCKRENRVKRDAKHSKNEDLTKLPSKIKQIKNDTKPAHCTQDKTNIKGQNTEKNKDDSHMHVSKIPDSSKTTQNEKSNRKSNEKKKAGIDYSKEKITNNPLTSLDPKYIIPKIKTTQKHKIKGNDGDTDIKKRIKTESGNNKIDKKSEAKTITKAFSNQKEKKYENKKDAPQVSENIPKGKKSVENESADRLSHQNVTISENIEDNILSKSQNDRKVLNKRKKMILYSDSDEESYNDTERKNESKRKVKKNDTKDGSKKIINRNYFSNMNFYKNDVDKLERDTENSENEESLFGNKNKSDETNTERNHSNIDVSQSVDSTQGNWSILPESEKSFKMKLVKNREIIDKKEETTKKETCQIKHKTLDKKDNTEKQDVALVQMKKPQNASNVKLKTGAVMKRNVKKSKKIPLKREMLQLVSLDDKRGEKDDQAKTLNEMIYASLSKGNELSISNEHTSNNSKNTNNTNLAKEPDHGMDITQDNLNCETADNDNDTAAISIENPTDLDRSSEKETIDAVPVASISSTTTVIDKSYCFRKKNNKYECRLCKYLGEDIVAHYKHHHPHSEIFVSRLERDAAKTAIKQSQEFDIELLGKHQKKSSYSCRFCYKYIKNSKPFHMSALENFFSHVVSMHTGEFEKICPECGPQCKQMDLDIPEPPKVNENQLFGYICGECNFTQISHKNLSAHIARHHSRDTNIFKIDLAVTTTSKLNIIKFSVEQNDMTSTSRQSPLRSIENVKDDKRQLSCEDTGSMRSDFPPAAEDDSDLSNNSAATVKLETESYVESLEEPMIGESSLPGVSVEDKTKTELTSENDILDYQQFKVIRSKSGTHEYVCCIDKNESHKTNLKICMNKHIQTNHKELWNGYCFFCKAIIMPKGQQLGFKEYFQHFVEKHVDNDNERPNEHDEVCLSKPSENSRRPPVSQSNDNSCMTPDFQYEEVQAEVMLKKGLEVHERMITAVKLMNVFKCAGWYCSFSTDCQEDALLHASTHAKVGGEGSLDCAYCNFDCSGDPGLLVDHVFKGHGVCAYACGHCFYRAAAGLLVLAHAAKAHAGKKPKVHVCSEVPTAPEEQSMPPLEDVVQKYVCAHCSTEGRTQFQTYCSEIFCEHMEQQHGRETSYSCNICRDQFQSSHELILHLRIHGLDQYQCPWCVHGADCEDKYLEHAAAFHPNTLPQVYLRVITIKDGKEQLELVEFTRKDIQYVKVDTSADKEDPVTEAQKSVYQEKVVRDNELLPSEDTPEEKYDTSVEDATPANAPPKRKLSSDSGPNQAEPPAKMKCIQTSATLLVKTESGKTYSYPQDSDEVQSLVGDELINCGICNFSSKCGLNIIEHMDECHMQQKMPDITDAEETSLTETISQDSQYPQSIPALLRFICGAKGCTDHFKNEDLFKQHWITHHSRTDYFRCAHCFKDLSSLLDGRPSDILHILQHIQMHDLTLYACSACHFYDYSKQAVKRHVDECSSKTASLLVVRDEVEDDVGSNVEASLTENAGPSGNADSSAQDDNSEQAAPIDLKPKQCTQCEYRSHKQEDIIEHCRLDHPMEKNRDISESVIKHTLSSNSNLGNGSTLAQRQKLPVNLSQQSHRPSLTVASIQSQSQDSTVTVMQGQVPLITAAEGEIPMIKVPQGNGPSETMPQQHGPSRTMLQQAHQPTGPPVYESTGTETHNSNIMDRNLLDPRQSAARPQGNALTREVLSNFDQTSFITPTDLPLCLSWSGSSATMQGKNKSRSQQTNPYNMSGAQCYNALSSAAQSFRAQVSAAQDYSVLRPAAQIFRPQAPAAQDFNVSRSATQDYNTPRPAAQSFRTPAPAAQNFRAQAPAAQSFRAKAPAAQIYNIPRPTAQTFRAQVPPAESFRAQAPAAQDYNVSRSATQDYNTPRPAAQSFRAQVPAAQSFRAQAPAAQSFRAQAPAAQSFRAQAPAAQSFRAQAPAAQSFRARAPAAQNYNVTRSAAQSFRAQVPAVQSFKAQAPAAQHFRAQAPAAQDHNAPGSPAHDYRMPSLLQQDYRPALGLPSVYGMEMPAENAPMTNQQAISALSFLSHQNDMQTWPITRWPTT